MSARSGCSIGGKERYLVVQNLSNGFRVSVVVVVVVVGVVELGQPWQF